MKLTNKKLSIQARDEILKIINEMENMEKLPSEQELSASLGVSRNTIREALKSLENDGIVSPRQGIGTFVIRNSKNIKSNLAVLDSFTKIITNHGYKPGTKSLSYKMTKADERIASTLNIEVSSNIMYLDRVRTADGKPVIYVEDYITYLENMYERFKEKEFQSLFEFLRTYNINIAFSSCNIGAVISDDKLNKKLYLNEPSALLYFQQIHYTNTGIPIMYSDSYFLSEKFDFNLIRKMM
jgi:GntR family transcriptional regulator